MRGIVAGSMKFFRTLGYLWLGLVLMGCAFEHSRPLKVATNLWPGYEPLYLAQYLGTYGKSVGIIQLASATEVMRAMAHGNVDAAAISLDEAILLMAKGMDLVVLMALDHSRGGHAVVASAGTQGGLEGLRIGVENTAQGAVVLSEALSQAGLQFSDIKLVSLSPDEHEDAFLQGQVDAVVTTEPVKTRLLSKGGRVLFDTSQAPELVVNVLVARQASLRAYPKQYETLIAGYREARVFMLSHRSEAEVFFCKRLQLDEEQLRRAFSGIYLPSEQDNLNWLSGNPSPYTESFHRVLDIMKARNLVQGSPVPKPPPDWVLEVSS